jgi:MFS family permease
MHPSPSATPNTDTPINGSATNLETAAQHPTRPGFLRAFSALHHRNYRLYWSGQLISLIGTWMQTTGVAWLVLQMTQSAWQLGIVSALQYVPVLLFALIGGVFADRWPKRELLLVTQSVAMIQAIIFFALVATHTIQVWEIYLLAFLLGVTTSLDQPTRSAFVVEMVGREDLSNGVALNSTMVSLVRILGPALGGLIIGLGGVGPLFLLNAISFIAALGGLALIDSRALHHTQQPTFGATHQSTWQSLREGLAYVWQSPAILSSSGWQGLSCSGARTSPSSFPSSLQLSSMSGRKALAFSPPHSASARCSAASGWHGDNNA